jgi:hypothetical protein
MLFPSFFHYAREKQYSMLYIHKRQLQVTSPTPPVVFAYCIPSSIPWLFRSGNAAFFPFMYLSFSVSLYGVGTSMV